MEFCAPIFWTVRADAAQANSAASLRAFPSETATHRAPQKVSPAAVVSTAFTLRAGTNTDGPPSQMRAPLLPIVTMSFPTPLACMAAAAFSADATSVTSMPEKVESSVSLGINRLMYLKISSGRGHAGAGFRTTVAPAPWAIFAALRTEGMGVSS